MWLIILSSLIILPLLWLVILPWLQNGYSYLLKDREMACSQKHLAPLPVYPVNCFIGRRELLSTLKSNIEKGLRLLVITGPPGFGKSTLTFVLGQRLEEQGFLVLYFLLNDKTTVNSASELILETLKQVPLRDPVRQLQEFLKDELKMKTLLILDSTEDLQEKENKEFVKFLENVGSFAANVQTIVITTQAIGSRLRLLPFEAQSIPLDPLNDDESKKLFKKMCGVVDPQRNTALDELCKECNGMPWMLNHAASQINQVGNNIESLLHDLRSSPGKLLLQEEHIALKMKIFLSRLPEDLKTSLATLSVFPAYFIFDDALSLFPNWMEVDLFDKLKNLQNNSLLKFDKEAKTYKIDNVVQSAVSKAKLDDFIYQEYNKAVKIFVNVFLQHLKQIHVKFISHENKEALEEYAKHKRNISHAFTLAIEYKLIQAVDVSTEVLNLLNKCMNFQEFETVYEGLAKIVQDDIKRNSDCLTSLGFKLLCYHGKDNCTEAKKVLIDASVLQEMQDPVPETEERAHCLSKLGLCLAMSGEVESGKNLIKRGIDIRMKLYNTDGGVIKEMLIAGGYCDLAMATSNHSITAAIEIWEDKCLNVYQRILNIHPFTASLLQYIGDAYHKDKKYQEAYEHKSNALNMRKSLFTTKHEDTLRSHVSLAKTLIELNRSEEALELLEKTMFIQAKVKASPEDIRSTRQLMEQIKNPVVQQAGNALEMLSIDALEN